MKFSLLIAINNEYSYSLCETLQDDSVQEETINSDQEAGTCMQIPPGYPLGKKKVNTDKRYFQDYFFHNKVHSYTQQGA